MAEKRFPLKIPQGLYKNGTRNQAAGRWYDANLVRFLDETVVRPVGGWRRAPSDSGAAIGTVAGVPRGATAWLDDSGSIHIGIGTTQGLYTVAGGVLHAISPTSFVAGHVDTTVPGTTNTSSSQGASAYGLGPYGSGAYSQGSTLGVRNEADNWQLDIFGSFLVAVCTSDGRLLVWEGDPATPAQEAEGNPPTGLRGVVVTPERFVVALGAFGNVRQLAWASQETSNTWDAADTNSAGDFILSTDGRIMCGAKTRRETLIWTDCDVWTMTYIGGELIYRFDQVGDQCGIIAPRAFAAFDGKAIWMGRKSFHLYDGYVRPLPSEVHDYVFSDLNETQAAKIWSTTVSEYGEVWWFYPSAKSLEVDRYVVYNYREGHWTTGVLSRTAGVDKGAAPYPIMIAPTGEIYEHEYGFDHDGAVPFVESGPVMIGDGDTVARVQKLYPDEKTLGDVRATFATSLEVMGTERDYGPYSLAAETDVRFTARQVRVRLEEVRATDWRVGTMTLGATPGGLR